MKMKKAGIIGGTGYTGGELARILAVHPKIDVTSMTSRQSAGKKVSDLHTYLKGYADLEFTEKLDTDVDIVFVATPHGVAMKELPALADAGIKVIDMSGDYRLHDPVQYQKWYGHEHTDVKHLDKAVYGLPELFRSSLKNADIIANPGCYATSAILAMAPLFKANAVESDVIVDGKSGTSGAGMVPSARIHHPYCGESMIPYGTGTHRHTPEMEMALNMFSKKNANVLFSPHLLPIVRGIISTCYLNLKKDLSEEDVQAIYQKQYGKEHFVHVVDEPSIRAVVASNHCQVGVKVFGRKVVAFSTLDNLVKGASGQAVQCANLMLGINEKTGLDVPGLGV